MWTLKAAASSIAACLCAALLTMPLAAPASADDAEDAAIEEARLATQLEHLINTGRCVNCDLTNAKIGAQKLNGANLTGSDLSEANLTGADFWGAELRRADLTDLDVDKSIGITEAEVGSSGKISIFDR